MAKTRCMCTTSKGTRCKMSASVDINDDNRFCKRFHQKCKLGAYEDTEKNQSPQSPKPVIKKSVSKPIEKKSVSKPVKKKSVSKSIKNQSPKPIIKKLVSKPVKKKVVSKSSLKPIKKYKNSPITSKNIIEKMVDVPDKFFFYSKSKDATPGKGTKEHVNNPNDYENLEKIKDWRKILSNFHVCEFKYNGYRYNTIEHAFQASKINMVDNDKGYLFTVDSGSEIGMGDGNVARKNRKLLKLDKEQLFQWNKIKKDVMYEISLAKYKSCKYALDVLKETKNAKLWHIIMRSPHPMRFDHLEQIRDLL